MTSESKNEPSKKKADDAVDLSLIRALLDGESDRRGNLISILQGTQNAYGYLPAAALEEISARTGHSLSEIYSVATFYSQFRLKHAGKYTIRVCHGTACHVQESDSITFAISEELGISEGETTDDLLFTLESVACLGCCSLAPVMMIGGETFGNLTSSEAVKIIKGIRRREGATR